MLLTLRKRPFERAKNCYLQWSLSGYPLVGMETSSLMEEVDVYRGGPWYRYAAVLWRNNSLPLPLVREEALIHSHAIAGLGKW